MLCPYIIPAYLEKTIFSGYLALPGNPHLEALPRVIGNKKKPFCVGIKREKVGRDW